MLCPYCGEEAEFINNQEIYGRQYGKSYMAYWCRKDDARVGTHNNTKTPLGTMANAELRKWRIRAHATIDPLWKNGKMKRKEVYKILREKFGKEIHIGESDVEQCKQIISEFSNYNGN